MNEVPCLVVTVDAPRGSLPPIVWVYIFALQLFTLNRHVFSTFTSNKTNRVGQRFQARSIQRSRLPEVAQADVVRYF